MAATLVQSLDILLNCRMMQHLGIHGWRDEHRLVAGQKESREGIVGNAVGKLPNDIGCSGGHYQRIGPFCQCNMLYINIFQNLEGVRIDLILRERLQGQWGDELKGIGGGHDLHFRIIFLE